LQRDMRFRNRLHNFYQTQLYSPKSVKYIKDVPIRKYLLQTIS